MDDQTKFMQRAIDLSVENVRLQQGGPFGAVITRAGEIVAEGTNLVTSTNDPTAHAEVTAIRRACAVLKSFQLEGCDLYTSCEPCPMCLGAIYWARPARIFFGGTHKDAAEFGFDDSFIYQQARLPVDQRHIPMKQLLGAEALAGFMEWQRSTAKILY
jgi:guanine deaminase